MVNTYKVTALDARGERPNVGHNFKAAKLRAYTAKANGYADIARKKKQIRAALEIKRSKWQGYNESKKRSLKGSY